MSTQDGNLRERQACLVQRSVALLRQGIELLERLDDEAYTQPHASRQRVGGHMRHILEFYECFLAGLDSTQIDYDARKRDESIERVRGVAIARARTLVERLLTHSELRGDEALWVRVEDCELDSFRDPWLLSSVGRELQVLAGHTTHHYALIGLILGSRQIRVQDGFGVAPSTLRFRSGQFKAEAA